MQFLDIPNLPREVIEQMSRQKNENDSNMKTSDKKSEKEIKKQKKADEKQAKKEAKKAKKEAKKANKELTLVNSGDSLGNNDAQTNAIITIDTNHMGGEDMYANNSGILFGAVVLSAAVIVSCIVMAIKYRKQSLLELSNGDK